ncbi:uncharacterized protein A4U43_C07F23620 [Asparagus officinalis]|uniref:Uncharacterized protein n=1 Tax=Asparagus officinalis TaxID=4686 RepID=A0A5P1EEI8_ASPOF|nr:uncharacterized protein A4U43_C07F23620 [Asparagus officinalis]
MIEVEVIRLDDSSPSGSVEAPQGGGAEAITRDSKAKPSAGRSESSRHEKEHVYESEPSSGLKYPFLHRVDETGDEELPKMYEYLIGTSEGGQQYVQKPNPKHFFEVTLHLDARGIVLGSCIAQSKSVEQFYLPQNDEYLRGERYPMPLSI